MSEHGKTETTEDLLDEAIARNQASIDRIHKRIEEILDLLKKLPGDLKELPAIP